MNYYELLGVSKDSTENELKKQYRSLSYKFHPDRNPNGGEQMQKLNEAYDTLKDPIKRQAYDNSFCNPLDVLLEKMFRSKEKRDPIDELFRDDFQKDHLEDLDTKIELTFKESYQGIQFPINIKRYIHHGKTKCYENEKIYLDIPAGIDDGEILKLIGKGNCNHGQYSDLKIHIKILPHEYFERKGLDLIFRKHISFRESICGFESHIMHLNDTSLKLQSSRGNIIQNYDEKIIKQKGFIRDKDIGNLIIIFKVNVDKKLNSEQLSVLESVF
jgi:DnaJ-class molecular chaperone